MAGQAGTGGTGAAPHLSGATAAEEAILDALFLEATELDGASLEQLVELGGRIGLARGYAMCRCTFNPDQPPDSVEQLLSSCATDEAGTLRGFTWFPSAERGPRTNQDLARCLGEESLVTPGLEQALRCVLRQHQRDGQAWLDLCSIPHAFDDSSAWPHIASNDCPNAEALSLILETCGQVTYCADGKRVSPPRCTGTKECEDGSDERGCFDFVGYDMLQCGDEIMAPQRVCDSSCGQETKPAFCSEALPDRFLCADGSDVDKYVVCDRKADCADGTDELYCLR